MLTKIGLDLGYANITLSDSTAEIYREPSVALIRKSPKVGQTRILAVGNAALTPEGGADECILARPFKNGMFFDHQLTEEVIMTALTPVRNKNGLRVVIGVPSDILPKQERDLFSMLDKAGVDTAFSVSRAVAAVIGAGYSPSISAVSVNVGGMSTEVAVLHNGELLYSSRTTLGGEDFDRAVKQYVLEQGDVNISLMVARAIKERLGAVWKGKPNDSIDIEGTLALTGNKIRMNIATEDIVGVFEKPIQLLINAIVDALKQVPANAVEAVLENGIILTGGAAELYGLDILISRVLGISVTRPERAIDCVAKGLSRINGFIPQKSKGGRNITAQLATLYVNTKK
ncbi:MAG: rod shape-determining protein [Clostridia bacterium]|nr:rod shape-determining protein [Clostridia bacterium]